MNRGLSCRISEGHRLWELGYATKEIEKRSPLNASDPQSEAVTKRGSLRAALVSLNHGRLAIVWEKVGPGAVCSASSDRDGDATRSSRRAQECSNKRANASLRMEGWRQVGFFTVRVCVVNQ